MLSNFFRAMDVTILEHLTLTPSDQVYIRGFSLSETKIPKVHPGGRAASRPYLGIPSVVFCRFVLSSKFPKNEPRSC